MMVTFQKETPQTECIFVDFMAYARKVPIKKINENGGSLFTFDLFNHLSQKFTTFKNDRIHLIFDLQGV